jgi:MFS transporter, DHA1 family, multidrug resistance protein
MGLFLFGWLSRPDIHWIAPIIGVAIYCGGVFVVFQNLHVYMADCYPQFAASLFAATDFTKSAFAVGAIVAGRPLYTTLGIGGGSSLLAGLMILCVFGVFALHHHGIALRKRSKFTTGS